MSQQELLARVVPVLDSLGIEYMVTGSIASSLQGEPRSTHDVDLVVVIPPSSIDALAAAFPLPGFLLQKDAITEALQHRSMFNLLSLTDGDKVDFWLLTDEPFDRSRFGRRMQHRFGSTLLWFSAPEDTILAKLRWAKMSGGSQKQMNDAASVMRLQGDSLDQSYLQHWASALDVEVLLAQIGDLAS